MKDQLDLFIWVDNRPTAEVIDLLPALCRKAAFEVIYRVPVPKDSGTIIRMERTAA